VKKLGFGEMGFFLIKKEKEKKKREMGFYIYWD
jgi:hypothetical protein